MPTTKMPTTKMLPATKMLATAAPTITGPTRTGGPLMVTPRMAAVNTRLATPGHRWQHGAGQYDPGQHGAGQYDPGYGEPDPGYAEPGYGDLSYAEPRYEPQYEQEPRGRRRAHRPDEGRYQPDATGQRFVPPYVQAQPDSSQSDYLDDTEYGQPADPGAGARHSAGRHSGGHSQ